MLLPLSKDNAAKSDSDSDHYGTNETNVYANKRNQLGAISQTKKGKPIQESEAKLETKKEKPNQESKAKSNKSCIKKGILRSNSDEDGALSNFDFNQVPDSNPSSNAFAHYSQLLIRRSNAPIIDTRSSRLVSRAPGNYGGLNISYTGVENQ
jgi:nitric oxide reductase activation protein